MLSNEGVYSKTTKINYICFQLIKLLIFIDVSIKFNLAGNFNEVEKFNWISFLPELILLIIFFYVPLFLYANKKIFFHKFISKNEKYPFKKICLTSIVVAASSSCFIWLSRVAIYYIRGMGSSFGFSSTSIIIFALIIITLIIIFVLLYVGYSIAFIFAKNRK